RILVTNDDGVFSEGIKRLASALGEVGEVVTVAPDQERSAAGHSLTLHHPLRAKLVGPERWSVDGTPTDCVNWGALHLLKDDRPRLLFSGINLGLNLGDDVTYSGTVSAAFEGTIIGIPSVAISQEIETGFSFDAAASFAKTLARHLLESPLPPGTLINVNVPAGVPKGVRVTRLGKRRYGEAVIEKKDPRGRPYYWIGSTIPEGDLEEGTDISAVAEKWIALSPLHLDLTDYKTLPMLEDVARKLIL
ncbi:MAG TPA: 5'/3'-nucleotidase SurE, partial [Thermoanaerobaculia bacterium]|nr:5'/3'-nucleotidase SurE [Thermoanaerobaculia bacterium]